MNRLALTVGGFLLLLMITFQSGRLWEAREHEKALRAAVESALANEREQTQQAIARERAAVARLEEFRNRDDQESIDWAAVPIPAGELERLRHAIDGLSADPGGLPD